MIKWEGYGHASNTWENEDNVLSKELVDEFEKSKPGSDAEPPRSKRLIKRLVEQPIEEASPTPQSRPQLKGASLMVSHANAVEDVLPGEWENLVKEVDTMERNSNGELMIHLNWSNGEQTAHPAPVANKACPQIVISFYEKHLKFNSPPTSAI